MITTHPAKVLVLVLLVCAFHVQSGAAFSPTHKNGIPTASFASSTTPLNAAPSRLDDNIDGPLYVNDKCINCAACAMFAPDVFQRNMNGDLNHVVHHQPETTAEVETARAALSACPVAAIRVETDAHRHHRNMAALTPTEKELATKLAINPKFNGLELPFPRQMVMRNDDDDENDDDNTNNNSDDVYYVGHHNEKSFGAIPYLVKSQKYGWIMVDTPRFTKAAVTAVTSITGPNGPNYLFLTHVDDTEGHDKWAEEFSSLKRIFHSGDLGRHNWRGDLELENVEILLSNEKISDGENGLQFYTMTGEPVDDINHDNNNNNNNDDDEDVYIVHTPGHSPGSITLWKRPNNKSANNNSPGIIFTGDTYAYTTRDGGRMTSFSRYGNNRQLQSKILPQIVSALDWTVVAGGHGHPRTYSVKESQDGLREKEMEAALEELTGSRVRA